ncbi:MAG TPA: hypothetical protein VHT28_04360 [Silvibacterium sp.]|nr:hypothetical protein [Silvibacterium sp.]
MSAHIDSTHAAPDAAFLSEKAQQLWGTLGVGSIHGLNPTPVQYNAIQKWVIARNRLGIPALFIEEGLHGLDTGTIFPPYRSCRIPRSSAQNSGDYISFGGLTSLRYQRIL